MQGTISRRLWAKAGAERIPLTGAFELLPICNFACKMCYVRKSRAEVEKAGGLMDGKRWLEIAKDAAKCGLLFPLLTGGEPFLYEDFQEVFAGMQDLGMQVSINSNASLIDQNMARWLGRHTPTRINITLYGASEETYQKLCGNGESFLKVKNAVRWLKQYGVPIKLNASITPQNVQDLESMISYAKECQIPIRLTHQILYELQEINLLHEVVDENNEDIGYQPSMDINKMNVALLLDRLDTHGSEDFKIDKDKEFSEQWEVLMNAREEYYKSASHVLLKDL